MFVIVLVKKLWSTAICKIYDFEYLIYTRTQFVKVWNWCMRNPLDDVIYVQHASAVHIVYVDFFSAFNSIMF